MSYKGTRAFGWARRRSRRCSTSAAIRTASPRCSHRGADPKERRVTPWVHEREFHRISISCYFYLIFASVHFFVQHEIASLSCVLLMPPPSEYCERGGSSEWCFMHWGTTIRLQVEAWPDVARMILSCLFVLGDSTGWSLV